MRAARTSMSLALLVLLARPAASAGPPDPAQSTVPRYVRVVGTSQGIPDRTGRYTVVLRDAAAAVCPGVPVTLDFGNCSDTRLAMNQAPDAMLLCTNDAITVVTNALGEATFTVVGASGVWLCGGTGCPPGAGAGCVRICAGGVPLGNATAVVYDLDGVSPGAEDGINALDIDFVRNEIACAGLGGPYHGRVDYNMDGFVSGVDLATYRLLVLIPAMVGGGSRQGSGGGGFCAGPFVPFSCP